MKKKSKHTKEKDIGFSIPSNYFGNFQASLLSKIEQDKFTENHNKKLGIQIPENYFETSKKDILQKIELDNQKELPERKTVRKLIYLIPAAAVLLIAYLFLVPNTIDSTENLADLDFLFQEEEQIEYEDSNLLSIFIEEDEIEASIDDYVLSNIVPEALYAE